MKGGEKRENKALDGDVCELDDEESDFDMLNGDDPKIEDARMLDVQVLEKKEKAEVDFDADSLQSDFDDLVELPENGSQEERRSKSAHKSY